MGIRFRCPQCSRRLNIKSAQAGKKGVCPKCREGLVVPWISEINHKGDDIPASELTRLNNALTEKSEKLIKQTREAPKNDANLSQPSDVLPDELAETKESNPIDPIQDAPHLMWHIRNSHQVESGPIKAKSLRKKVDAGIVLASDYVCREDWQDWRLAADVFPELGLSGAEIPVASDSVFTNSSYEIPGVLTAKARKARAKQRLTTIQIWLCALGLLITAALCYLLIKLI